MATDDLKHLAHAGDPIRVVPLHDPAGLTTLTAAAPAATPPNLTYRGGQMLESVKVFTVFWGQQWSSAPLAKLQAEINTFFDFILTSELMDQLAEYNTGPYTVGHGTRIGTDTVASPAPRHVASEGAIQHLLRQEITVNAKWPKPDANTLYFVYLPPGTIAIQGGSRSCQAFCGYHNSLNGMNYATMPFPGCAGCTGGLSELDALTSTSSHELCEAITDTVPGQGWYDDSNGEIGDICAWKTKKLGQYMVQLEWSDKAGSCI
ncbi:MAG TPA: hypothetical protein VKR22_10515 [Acidimicrobiales bacterium]|nr:hypothetical protein [Acidimicrobiales bacterium]